MVETKGKKIISKVLKVLLYIAISFVCLLALVLLYYVINSQVHANDENYRPTVSIYTIVSPSMTPVINVYDVVVNVKADTPKDIEVGDIITYKSQAANSEGMTITHRVIAIDQLPDGTYEYLTQGDNNSEPDSLYVTFDNVIGKEIMIIPGLGRLQFLIANHKWWLILLIIPIGIYLVREIFKLIDLFNLRNKVDRITGEKEESIIVKKKIENIERKEKIKEELEIRELEKDAIKRSSEEPEGFLEKYTETMVIVPINKYDKANKPKQAKTVDEEVPVIAPSKTLEEPTSTKEATKEAKKEVKEKEVDLPKNKVKAIEEKQTEEINKDVKEKNTNDQYEILDTDELSTKIKEYDSKISQLDKMIKDMESISKTAAEENQEMPEVDDFLQGTRLKVVKVELTNNNEEVRKERRKKKAEQIDLSGTSSSHNPNKKIARPDSVDIKDLRSNVINDTITEPSKEKKTTKKDHLNLNPRNVKKVTRPNRTRRRNLNLNPSKIKKVRRPRVLAEQEKMKKQVNPAPPQNLRPSESSQPRTQKEKFIKIEKIKK